MVVYETIGLHAAQRFLYRIFMTKQWIRECHIAEYGSVTGKSAFAVMSCDDG